MDMDVLAEIQNRPRLTFPKIFKRLLNPFNCSGNAMYCGLFFIANAVIWREEPDFMLLCLFGGAMCMANSMLSILQEHKQEIAQWANYVMEKKREARILEKLREPLSEQDRNSHHAERQRRAFYQSSQHVHHYSQTTPSVADSIMTGAIIHEAVKTEYTTPTNQGSSCNESSSSTDCSSSSNGM